MKKYRIVKTESGDYKIQKSILFGLFWVFAKETVAELNTYPYKHGYNPGDNGLFNYNSVSDAKKSIHILKGKKRFIYKNYVIKPMKTSSYNILGNYEYRYFVKKKNDKTYSISFESLEEAKSYVDKKYNEAEEYNKKFRIKEIVKYC